MNFFNSFSWMRRNFVYLNNLDYLNKHRVEGKWLRQRRNSLDLVHI